MKKLLLIATGGTIACQDSGRGLTSKIGAKALLQYIPDIARRYELKIMQISNRITGKSLYEKSGKIMMSILVLLLYMERIPLRLLLLHYLI